MELKAEGKAVTDMPSFETGIWFPSGGGGPKDEPSSTVGGGDGVAARGGNKGSNHSRQGNGGTAQVMDADGPALALLSWTLMARESSTLCRRETRRGDLQPTSKKNTCLSERDRRERPLLRGREEREERGRERE